MAKRFEMYRRFRIGDDIVAGYDARVFHRRKCPLKDGFCCFKDFKVE